MKKSWWAGAALSAVVCLGLMGCTPGGENSPSPSASQVVTTAAPEPTPTPTSKWSGDEQAAVDAVQLSIAAWNRIGQSMDPGDFNSYYDVATVEAAKPAMALWEKWLTNGWHLVGDPYFIPQEVSLGTADDKGQRLLVVGCYIIEGSDVVDLQGNSLTGTDRIERGVMKYTVLKTPDRTFLEAGSEYQEGTC